MHPLLFELHFGGRSIPFHTYGLMIAIGFILGVFTVRKLARRSGLDPDQCADLAFWLLLLGFLGSRLLFILTRLSYFLENPLDVFKVWEGGLVFFGGLITATGYAIWHFRRHNLNPWRMIDILSPGLVIAHAFGRLGCLSAGCCYGHPTAAPWGVRFDSELVDFSLRGIPLHPTQIYEFVSLMVLFFGLLWIFRIKKIDGQVGLAYFMIYPLIRSLIEVFRGDTIRGFVVEGLLSTSQFISALVFLGALLVLNLRLKTAARQK
ncbi:MAG: prolipoprotein diacylglyceryl transferase [Bdellovibrionales bacterium]|nr:prolipoprotein diacylglyceryl transferase [Bdellovibrionales bacterium]